MIFKPLKQISIGLDLGDLSFEIIQLEKKKGGFFVSGFSGRDIPEGLIRGGEVKQEDELAGLIRESFEKPLGGLFQSREVICNLPEEKVFIQTISLPSMEREELDKAIRWEIEAHIPLGIDDVYLDWRVIKTVKKNSADYCDILIAAAPKDLVESYVNLLRKSGLSPIVLEPESVAVARALSEDISSPTLIVNIGGNGTNLIIFSGGTICLTSRAAASDRLFTETLVNRLNGTKEEAEKIKSKVGLEKLKDGKNEKIFNVLEPLASELANQIQEYVSFYHERAGETNGSAGGISQILLSGPGALLAGLPEFLSEKLSLPVHLGDCLKNVSFCAEFKKDKRRLFKRSDCVVAFGLAIRNFK